MVGIEILDTNPADRGWNLECSFWFRTRSADTGVQSVTGASMQQYKQTNLTCSPPMVSTQQSKQENLMYITTLVSLCSKVN